MIFLCARSCGAHHPAGRELVVEITIDTAKADLGLLALNDDDSVNSMQVFSEQVVRRVTWSKDVRVTLRHEFVHAARYVQAVEGTSWLSGIGTLNMVATPPSLGVVPPYRGGNWPPTPKQAAPEDIEPAMDVFDMGTYYELQN